MPPGGWVFICFALAPCASSAALGQDLIARPIDPLAQEDFAASRGYPGSTSYNVAYPALWGAFTDSIDPGEPVEFLVDTNGSGGTDHFVAAIGYDDTVGARRYACYDTWHRTVRWCDYRTIGSAWGVYGGGVLPTGAEPGALAMLAAPAMILLRRRRARAA